MEIGIIFVLQVLGGLSILATLLPFIRSDHWIIRIFDFPRMQIAVFILLIIAADFVLQDNHIFPEKIWLFCLISTFIYQAFKIYPYSQLSRKEVVAAQDADAHATLRLLVSNVYMYNKNVTDFLKIVSEADPDVILVVETDQWWTDELAGLKKKYPHSVLQPLENTYGMLLFSRLQLNRPEVRYLVEDDVPSIKTAVEIAPGQRIMLYCLHPRPPRPTKNQNTTERDIELIKVGKEIRNMELPVIVAGDLNDVAWSHTTRLFRKISGLLDPRVGRGLFSSFHAKIPFLRWPLDHVFHSEHFKLIRLKRLGFFGSDHFPIFTHLQLHPAAEILQDPPEAERVDLQEAVEILNKEKAL